MLSGQWLTVQDVAELLQVRIETVRRWVRRGELPVLELGGPRTVYRIRPDDLDSFVWQRYRSSNEARQPVADEQSSPASEPEERSTTDTPIDTENLPDQDIQALVDHLPAVTFREDPSNPGAPAFMSREIEVMLGYPIEEWSGNPKFWLERVHPEDREVVEAELARTDATGEPFKMAYRMIRRDGTTMWIQVDAVLVPDPLGGGMVWEGVIVDVTERKQIETALSLRQRQQRAVAELGQYALEGEPLNSLLRRSVNFVTRALEVEYSKIFEVLPGGDNLVLRAAAGWEEGAIGEVAVSVEGIDLATLSAAGDSQAAHTLLSNEPVIVTDLIHETRFDGPGMARDHGVRSGVSVTIPGLGRPYGVLGAHSTRPRTFTQEDVFFLQSVANVLASSVARTDGQWLTVTEVAEYLQVTEETVRRWIRRSELPALNLGGPRAGYRVYPSDLERFIRDRVIRP